MVRISDILKKTGVNSGQHPVETKPKPEIPQPLPDTQSKKPIAQKEQTAPGEDKPQGNGLASDSQSHKLESDGLASDSQSHKQECILNPMNETAANMASCKNSYLMGMQLIKEVFSNTEQLKPINLVQIEQWVNDIANCLISGDTELLNIFYGYASENYLYDHMVNTTIIAIEVGLGLDYNKTQLNELGLAAFLHDIGMIKVGKLEMQPRKLSEEEYNQIKNHPLYGAEILSKIKGISEPVIYVAKEEHERQNGSGYPKGIKNGEISEYGRIVAIVDVYEALTHNRPYSKKLSPHEAIKELIANDPLFDALILKVLIRKVGVYPISSLVELNSNEIGLVTMNNEEFPLRPVLQVLFDAKRRRLKNSRCVNLAKQFNLFIKKAINDEESAREIKEPIEI